MNFLWNSRISQGILEFLGKHLANISKSTYFIEPVLLYLSCQLRALLSMCGVCPAGLPFSPLHASSKYACSIGR